ncbi:nuclear transport factor 2 family protein [Leucobacter denitrificans]|uniref:Nuclear transport factor 2 family protein n=1 Tax=Leucobacter denitrificans TaxID=683042 RepID=A0A7G9S498_9MICO|nr:nuclear transport factor 2 family protein [Leucobacter denitrificans]QNN62673.1 nuclear transport factor 2 family protein [Leucobacter denitrificans]
MSAHTDQRLRELADRESIHRTLRRYAQGVDQRQWDLYRSAFAPGATVAIPGWIEGSVTAEHFIELLSGEFDAIRLSGQHHLANTLIEFGPTETLEGEASGPGTARSVTEFLAVNAERASDDPTDTRVRTQYSGGLQVDDLVRHDGEWLISHRVLVRKNDEQYLNERTPEQIALIADAATNPASAGL